MTGIPIINNKKLLVTGGAGFIGSNLVEAILQQNNQVVVLDNFSTGKKENIQEFISNPNFTFIEGDIRNLEDCLKACEGVDAILHQAAIGSVPRSIANPYFSHDNNVSGFLRILEAAKEKGVKRIVYASSSSVYGDHPTLPKVKPEEKAAEAQPEKSSAKETTFVNTTITDKPTTTTEMPILDSDKPIKTGAVDNPGDDAGAVTLGQGTIDGKGTKPVDEIVPTKGEGGGDVFDLYRLDKKPEYPGGIQNFIKEVGRRYKTPESASDAGVMKILVSFIVETDGSLSNIKVTRDPGFGLGREAIRVLQSMKTKWSPGIQKGQPVRTAYNLPISVVMHN